MKILKTLFKQKPSSNLVYDDRAFQIKDKSLVLEQDLEIKLPQQLKGKNIKQVEIIPKFKNFEVVFTYESNESQVKPNIMSIDLGLKNLANCTKNSMMWLFIMNKAASHRHVMLY